MHHPEWSTRKSYLMASVAAVGALATTAMVTLPANDAEAWQSPTKHRYLTKPLQLCDRGTFYVGGAPKLSRYGGGPQANQSVIQKIIGSMYVQFATPMVAKSWPLIIVHGSGYTGSCVEGTAGGTEGWADYTVRNGVPTYVVDQAGRGRSGFDQTVIHEGEALIDTDTTAAKNLILTLGGSTSTAWTSWFGHIVPEGATPPSDIVTGTMVRHGAPALQSDGTPAPAQDPLCTTGGQPAHCKQLGRIPMEPEAPWAVDQAIKSRIGNGAPAGLGTVIADSGNIAANAAYLALDAYKFNVPNTEATLPTSVAPNGQTVASLNTWTGRAVAELVEGLGGAVVATHSQSGQIGHHVVRILKEHGKLDLLKGLITDEGSCAFTGGGLALTGADFKNIPYLAFKGDYSATSAVCQASVDAVKAAGGKADYIQLDQAGWWQGLCWSVRE